MRKTASKNGLKVHAIAGTHVVLLGMNLPKNRCSGLQGFAIHRTDHTEGEAYWLRGMKSFVRTDPALAPGSTFSTREQPIQDFLWGDYSAKPDHSYTYRVLALKGAPEDLQPAAEVAVTIGTESPAGGDHDVYFNRGAASSQEYTRRFGNRRPGTQGGDDDPAWTWLSRGAHEAIIQFIRRATRGFGLRVCAYEFRLPSVLKELRLAHDRGADVQILYDAGKEPPRSGNENAAKAARIKSLCTERLPKPQALSHNKFIVLTQGEKAVAVLTGSTNFTAGGVFGQSNVVHVVEQPVAARAYLACWEELCANPDGKALKPVLSARHVLPKVLPQRRTLSVFSPRSSLDALDFYGLLASQAKGALFATFAFGMHPVFQEAYRSGKARLRYALLEKLIGPGVKKAAKPAALAAMKKLRFAVENRFAVGSTLALNDLEGWVKEQTTGLNVHVQYVHTKYMLVDPLGPKPIVVTGSANFSAASSNQNDENMVVITGNRRVADIYLGEFMRLWGHYAFREWAAQSSAAERSKPQFLDPSGEWWKRHFGDTALSHRRAYLAG